MEFEAEPRNWHRDDGFLVSTEQHLLQVDAIAEAMDSELIWWTMAPPADQLSKALRNSFCLGLYYVLPHSITPGVTDQASSRTQIGLARLITDGVTFGYLTDVYVLPEYQGQGLGRWLMVCLDEALQAWPHLRRLMLLTSSSAMIDLYRKTLRVKDWAERRNQNLILGMADGPAAPS
ncbi:hypothetical protein F4777DRAFT_83676 [Nemania sp. FL0916]|nr:hypothetical protein F4777DRAFT_83676 [Nemania sp. FL0916]